MKNRHLHRDNRKQHYDGLHHKLSVQNTANARQSILLIGDLFTRYVF